MVRELVALLARQAETLQIDCATLHRPGLRIPTIARVAAELPADLIVLTRHRDSHQLHQLEVRLEVPQSPFHSPCPVLVVPCLSCPREVGLEPLDRIGTAPCA